MSRVNDVAKEVLGEIVANSLNLEGWWSAESFLRQYRRVKDANRPHIGDQVSEIQCGGFTRVVGYIALNFYGKSYWFIYAVPELEFAEMCAD